MASDDPTGSDQPARRPFVVTPPPGVDLDELDARDTIPPPSAWKRPAPAPAVAPEAAGVASVPAAPTGPLPEVPAPGQLGEREWRLLTCAAVVVLWYLRSGKPREDVARARAAAPWYRTKTEPAFPDMARAARRQILAEQGFCGPGVQPACTEIRGDLLDLLLAA